MLGHTGIDFPQTTRPFGQRPLLAVAKPFGQFSDQFGIFAAFLHRGSPCSSSVLFRGEFMDFLNVEALSQRHEEAQRGTAVRIGQVHHPLRGQEDVTCDLVTLGVHQTKHLQAINPRIIELIIFTNILGGFSEFIRIGFQFSNLIFQCIESIGDRQVTTLHRLPVLDIERGVLPDHSAAHQFNPRILADGTLHVVAIAVEVEGDVLSLADHLSLGTGVLYHPVPQLGRSNGLGGFLIGRGIAVIFAGSCHFQQLFRWTHFTQKRAKFRGNIMPKIELRVGLDLPRHTDGARGEEALCFHRPKDFLGDGFRDTLGQVIRGIPIGGQTPELGDVFGQPSNSLRQTHT